MGSDGWVGVDLDGTLAVYDGWKGPEHIGAPVPKMVERVRRMLVEGKNVKIFTARVSHDGSPARIGDALRAREAISDWCWEHFGMYLEITNVKDYSMIDLYDDRAVQIIPNTGERVDGLE